MSETPVFDPQIQTEKIAFDAAEMIACEVCGRMNPPNRLKCMYCARELAIAVEDIAGIKPTLRKLEPWERGYNLIVREGSAAANVAAMAHLLLSDPEDVETVVTSGVPLPIARVESEMEALLVGDRLAGLGLMCSVVSDESLAAERPPVRLSALGMADGQLTLRDFNTGGSSVIDADRFALLVPGMVTAGRVDSLEKKRRGRKTKLLDETATASDGMLLDIYTRDDPTGFRVYLAGFDFSCLREDMGLLAGENLRLLIVRLVEYLPNVRLVNNYDSVRHALDRVWEVATRKDSQGLQRAGFGKVEFGSVVSSSNLSQFTKYSRLQWHLL